MRLLQQATRYEAAIIKVCKDAKLDAVVKAQEEAAKAADVARKLYEQYLKG